MRTEKSEYTFTCDRCGRSEVFKNDDPEAAVGIAKWKILLEATQGIAMISSGVDLCPSCYEKFTIEFMAHVPPIPPGISKAFEP